MIDDFELDFYSEMQLLKHLCFSLQCCCSWPVIKLVHPFSWVQPLHPMIVKPNQLEAQLLMLVDDEVIQLLDLAVLVVKGGGGTQSATSGSGGLVGT